MYFFISMFGTAAFTLVLLQIPIVRRKIFSWMERLADWHEKGTMDEDQQEVVDPFMLARLGEKMLK